VCCLAGATLPRLARVLALFRDVADEIVCAVDVRVPDDELACLDGVVDVIARCGVEPVGGMERNLAWLHGLCGGSWIFRVDSDEVPGAELLRALPRLMADPEILQYVLPRRWLFPDARHWLSDPPWGPDAWQLRLVRNLPGLMRFQGLHHTSVDPVPPFRHVDLPFYHLDLLDNSFEVRREKAARYESASPARLSASGHPLNDVYLPEKFDAPATAPVPPDDVELIESVQAELPVHPTRPTTTLPAATRTEIDRYWPWRDIPESTYHATWLEVPRIGSIGADELRTVVVRVRNDGTEHWPWGHRHPEIRLAYRWLTADGARVHLEGLRTPFTADVRPGGTVVQPIDVQGPAEPGPYVVEFDLVHEHVRWFGTGVRTPVVVR
jgi:hypothetical protein